MELKKIGLITKKKITENMHVLKEIVEFLQNNKKVILCDKNSALALGIKKRLNREEILQKADIAIVLGGDGSILKTARSVGYHEVLVLGVNLGRVGFLTEIDPKHLKSALKKILKEKKFYTDKRFILRVTVYRNGKKIKTSLALNEAVINQGSFARLIDLRTEINQRKVAHFRADGLIISTPTGSTGHSLSAGGPMVHPDLESLIITPICPASLSNRAIVIPSERQIKIVIETERKNEKTSEIGLTLDGQETFPLSFGDEIKIRRSGRVIQFIRLSESYYYRVLRRKLKWGV